MNIGLESEAWTQVSALKSDLGLNSMSITYYPGDLSGKLCNLLESSKSTTHWVLMCHEDFQELKEILYIKDLYKLLDNI